VTGNEYTFIPTYIKVGFEVLTVVSKKMAVFWVVSPPMFQGAETLKRR
jgi:hypothetical protein